MLGVEGTPWHSKAAALSSCSPVFAFQAVCVFARCNEAAELCGCCVPQHGEGTAGTGSMEVSCPVLCQPGAVPPAHHSVLGQRWWGQQPCCLPCAHGGDSRGEKGENVCSDVLQSVALLWYPARSGASDSSLHAALPGCSDGLGHCHHQDPPGNPSFVSPVGFSWLMPLQSRAHSAGVWPSEGVVGPGRCTVRFTALGYLLIK